MVGMAIRAPDGANKGYRTQLSSLGMNERLVAEFNNLVLPEPAERRSFLLESVKHTLSNQ